MDEEDLMAAMDTEEGMEIRVSAAALSAKKGGGGGGDGQRANHPQGCHCTAPAKDSLQGQRG